MQGATYYFYLFLTTALIPWLGYQAVKAAHRRIGARPVFPMTILPILLATCLPLSLYLDKAYEQHATISGDGPYAPRLGFILGFTVAFLLSVKLVYKKP